MSGAKTSSSRGVTLAVIALIAANLFWAGNFIVGESAVQSFDPLTLVLLRWAIALVPLVLLAQVIEKPDWRRILAAWRWILVSSGLGIAGYTLLLYYALQHTDAFNAALINAVNPALIAIGAAVFLRERLTPLAVAGIVAALTGVLVILCAGDLGRLLTVGFGWGELLMLGAVITWAAYSIVGRIAPKTPPIATTAAQVCVAVAVLTPLSFLTGGPHIPAEPEALWSLAFIAIFPSVGSYVLWNYALSVLPASGAGVFLNLITVFVALFTILVGDPVSPAQIIGGSIVIAGVLAANRRRARVSSPEA